MWWQCTRSRLDKRPPSTALIPTLPPLLPLPFVPRSSLRSFPALTLSLLFVLVVSFLFSLSLYLYFFSQIEIITVLDKSGAEWWEGEVDGRRGYFPAVYALLYIIFIVLLISPLVMLRSFRMLARQESQSMNNQYLFLWYHLQIMQVCPFVPQGHRHHRIHSKCRWRVIFGCRRRAHSVSIDILHKCLH